MDMRYSIVSIAINSWQSRLRGFSCPESVGVTPQLFSKVFWKEDRLRGNDSLILIRVLAQLLPPIFLHCNNA